MNFYTVAARMDREASEYAFNNIENHGNYMTAYHWKLEGLMARHQRIMDIGCQLLESFGSRMKSRHYMITIRPPENVITFEKFKKDVENYVEPLINYEYAFEQKGECEADLGKGFHVHIIMRGTTEQHYPSKLLRNAQRLFNYVAAHCIQVDTLRNLDKARAYIRGKKNDEQKMLAATFDPVWRASARVAQVIASGQVHPLANNLELVASSADAPAASGQDLPSSASA